VIRAPYLFAGALAAGLAASTAVRFSLAAAVLLALPGLVRSRVAVACLLLLSGWWWGSARLDALDRSALATSVGTAGRAVVTVAEPSRRGRWDVHVRADLRSWRGAEVHEPVLLQLPGTRAPPQGARLGVLGIIRQPPDYERAWLRRHGVHVVLRASTWKVIRLHGGVADRLHGWLARASTPGLTGERRAVLEGVVLGEDGGLSESLRQRFRASGLYHLLAVSGGNVIVVAGGAGALALMLGIGRLAAEVIALAAIAAYVLAVGPQPSVIRAGIAGARVARLADRAPARPLVRAAGRGGRAPRLESVERARSGIPALVRRRRVDLRARAALRTCARGLPDARLGAQLHRHLRSLRSLHGTDLVAPLSCDPRADRAGERGGRAGDAADARTRAARGDRAARGAAPRAAQRARCRIPRGLRTLLRRVAGSPGALARGGRRARVGGAPRGRLCLASWRTS
jgi:hypothetical protein